MMHFIFLLFLLLNVIFLVIVVLFILQLYSLKIIQNPGEVVSDDVRTAGFELDWSLEALNSLLKKEIKVDSPLLKKGENLIKLFEIIKDTFYEFN